MSQVLRHRIRCGPQGLGREMGVARRGLDLRVAEELADLGTQQRNAVESHLAQALAHLIKLAWIGDPDLYPKWAEEVDRHQDEACHTHTAAMKHDLDLDRIWRRGVRLANKSFRRHDEPELPRTPDCPFTLDALLAEAFDTDAAIARVSGALGAMPE